MSLEPIEVTDGLYVLSRSAWRGARTEATAAMEKVKAAISKSRDARAAKVGAILDRIIRRIPDVNPVLEALADAEESGGAAAPGLKEQARKTVQLASYYLRSDRLVAMVRENPYLPVNVDGIFARALQTTQRELK